MIVVGVFKKLLEKEFLHTYIALSFFIWSILNSFLILPFEEIIDLLILFISLCEVKYGNIIKIPPANKLIPFYASIYGFVFYIFDKILFHSRNFYMTWETHAELYPEAMACVTILVLLPILAGADISRTARNMTNLVEKTGPLIDYWSKYKRPEKIPDQINQVQLAVALMIGFLIMLTGLFVYLSLKISDIFLLVCLIYLLYCMKQLIKKYGDNIFFTTTTIMNLWEGIEKSILPANRFVSLKVLLMMSHLYLSFYLYVLTLIIFKNPDTYILLINTPTIIYVLLYNIKMNTKLNTNTNTKNGENILSGGFTFLLLCLCTLNIFLFFEDTTYTKVLFVFTSVISIILIVSEINGKRYYFSIVDKLPDVHKISIAATLNFLSIIYIYPPFGVIATISLTIVYYLSYYEFEYILKI